MITTHSNKLALSKYWNLFNECTDFSTFQRCLKKIAKECSKNQYLGLEKLCSKQYDSGRNITLYENDCFKKACGDIFEVFSECLFRYFSTDDIFGCEPNTYKSTNDTEDLGCDGNFILSVNGGNAYVQIKYRNNQTEKPFDLEVFSKLFFDAWKHGFEPENEKHRLIFITNLNAGERTFIQCATPIVQNIIKENFKKLGERIIIIGRNEIEEKVNGHLGFWKEFIQFCK